MNKVIHVTVRERKQDGQSVFEGVAQLEGGTSFKLTKSKSTETKFASRSTVVSSATNFAKRYDLVLDIVKPDAKNGSSNSRRKTTSNKVIQTTSASDSIVS